MPLSSITKQFGRTVRLHRIGVGLTQEALAEKAGLHPTYISMVARGVRNPTLDVSARIAKALKISLPTLIENAQRGNTTK
jgi:transcriptional regulator with XRE-family HTH domain